MAAWTGEAGGLDLCLVVTSVLDEPTSRVYSLPMEHILFLQATTGTLHRSKSCSVTRRTRYGHFPVAVVDHDPQPNSNEMSREQVATARHCHKCWDGSTAAA